MLATPGTRRISLRVASSATRLVAAISATRSQLPFVVWSARIADIALRRRITGVAIGPLSWIEVTARTMSSSAPVPTSIVKRRMIRSFRSRSSRACAVPRETWSVAARALIVARPSLRSSKRSRRSRSSRGRMSKV